MHVWRDRIERWLTPLAVRSPLSPNAITVIAFVIMVAAAAMLMLARHDPRRFLLALPLVAIGGLCDALDGAVARAQNRTSRFGDFLDHFLDRAADLSLVAGWTLGTLARPPLMAATLILVLLNGYIGTQLEATFRERSYGGTGRAEFVLAMIAFPLFAYTLARLGMADREYGSFRIVEWMTVGMAAFALLGILQRLGEARKRSSETKAGF